MASQSEKYWYYVEVDGKWIRYNTEAAYNTAIDKMRQKNRMLLSPAHVIRPRSQKGPLFGTRIRKYETKVWDALMGRYFYYTYYTGGPHEPKY